jgi:hypothetical protein
MEERQSALGFRPAADLLPLQSEFDPFGQGLGP